MDTTWPAGRRALVQCMVATHEHSSLRGPPNRAPDIHSRISRCQESDGPPTTWCKHDAQISSGGAFVAQRIEHAPPKRGDARFDSCRGHHLRLAWHLPAFVRLGGLYPTISFTLVKRLAAVPVRCSGWCEGVPGPRATVRPSSCPRASPPARLAAVAGRMPANLRTVTLQEAPPEARVQRRRMRVTPASRRRAAAVDAAARPCASAVRGGACRGWRSRLLSTVLVFWARTRPGFDPYGWLVWGHQTLLKGRWTPTPRRPGSRCPLPVHLSRLRARRAPAGAAAVDDHLGRRVACRRRVRGPDRLPAAVPLDGVRGGRGGAEVRRRPGSVAAVFAGLALLRARGLHALHPQLAVGPDDRHARPWARSTATSTGGYRAGVRARRCWRALGRPLEVWPFLGAVLQLWAWMWSGVPARPGWLLVGAGWRRDRPAPVVRDPGADLPQPAFVAGDERARPPGPPPDERQDLRHDPGRFLALNELAIELAALLAVADRGAAPQLGRRSRWPWASGSCWVCVEIAFALHGWPGLARYMFEAEAVVVVLAGMAVGLATRVDRRTVASAAPSVGQLGRAGAGRRRTRRAACRRRSRAACSGAQGPARAAAAHGRDQPPAAGHQRTRSAETTRGCAAVASR